MTGKLYISGIIGEGDCTLAAIAPQLEGVSTATAVINSPGGWRRKGLRSSIFSVVMAGSRRKSLESLLLPHPSLPSGRAGF